MVFNLMEPAEFIDKVSDYTMQLTFKKFLLVEFKCFIKEYPPLSEKATKILLPFPATLSV